MPRMENGEGKQLLLEAFPHRITVHRDHPDDKCVISNPRDHIPVSGTVTRGVDFRVYAMRDVQGFRTLSLQGRLSLRGTSQWE